MTRGIVAGNEEVHVHRTPFQKFLHLGRLRQGKHLHHFTVQYSSEGTLLLVVVGTLIKSNRNIKALA